MKNYRAARKRVNVSVGESVRIIRELQGLSQNELARHTGISQATISAIENDRVRLGVEREDARARAQVPSRRSGVSRLGRVHRSGGIASACGRRGWCKPGTPRCSAELVLGAGRVKKGRGLLVPQTRSFSLRASSLQDNGVAARFGDGRFVLG